VVETGYVPTYKQNITTTFTEDTMMEQQGRSTWWNDDRSLYILRCMLTTKGYIHMLSPSRGWESNKNACTGYLRTMEFDGPQDFWTAKWLSLDQAEVEVHMELVGTYWRCRQFTTVVNNRTCSDDSYHLCTSFLTNNHVLFYSSSVNQF